MYKALGLKKKKKEKEKRSFIAQDGIELVNLLPTPPDYRHMPLTQY
jgi:hypothetical protein